MILDVWLCASAEGLHIRPCSPFFSRGQVAALHISPALSFKNGPYFPDYAPSYWSYACRSHNRCSILTVICGTQDDWLTMISDILPSWHFDDPPSWIFGPIALEISISIPWKLLLYCLRSSTRIRKIVYTMHARSRTIVVVSAVFGFLAILAVTARFWSRRIQRQKFGIDDGLLIIALVSQFQWSSQVSPIHRVLWLMILTEFDFGRCCNWYCCGNMVPCWGARTIGSIRIPTVLGDQARVDCKSGCFLPMDILLKLNISKF